VLLIISKILQFSLFVLIFIMEDLWQICHKSSMERPFSWEDFVKFANFPKRHGRFVANLPHRCHSAGRISSNLPWHLKKADDGMQVSGGRRMAGNSGVWGEHLDM
jgi:hypothetical protein